MHTDGENNVNSYEVSADVIRYPKDSFNLNNSDNAVTVFEFLKWQLATGEITLHEYMMICQALTS